MDRHLRTSDPRIYALGECCQIDGRTLGLMAPVWRQAEVLADTLAGYIHVDTPTQLKVSGIDLYSAGAFSGAPDSGDQVLRDREQGIYRRLVFDGDRLVGAILLGDRIGGPWYGQLIETRQPLGHNRP